MPLIDLPAPERDLVRQCLAALACGPFLDDYAFRTRIGIPRATALGMLGRWSTLDDGADGSDECMALDNCMNEICHELEIEPNILARWIGVDRDVVKGTYVHWARSRGWVRSRAG